jgi:twitching motility protein PilT
MTHFICIREINYKKGLVMNMNVREILENITKEHASDIFVVAGRPLTYKVSGKMHTYQEERMKPDMCRDFVTAIYELADHRDISQFETTGDDDFSFAIVGVSRFRVSTYKQRGSYSAVIRIITFTLPQPSELMIPDAVMELANTNKGMVLVTGPAGGGKSTTLACLIDKINTEQEAHIITLEDPLEYLHTHKKSIVSQREICTDTENYLTALRASLRQSPDVILLGEMRDYETINTAMTAAETGHLVLATLHTQDAASTVNRIIDVFPEHQQQQIRIQLAGNLQGIVAQQLLMNREQTGRLAAFEILVATPALRNLIREGKTHQIPSYIQTGSKFGMICMDAYLAQLVRQNKIDRSIAEERCYDPLSLERYMHGL